MAAKTFVAGEVLTAADVNDFLQNNGLREVLYYTSSGTFVKADYPWLRAIRVRCIGGGGGGGSVPNSTAGRSRVGSGGGAGAYAEVFITDIAGLDASVTVTRGAGGSATNNGAASSSFGLTCGGGEAGDSSTDSANPIRAIRGPGGVATGGAVNADGEPGDFGIIVIQAQAAGCAPGKGASSFFGGGGLPGFLTGTGSSVGQPGKAFGAGGAGGLSVNAGGSASGGAGADGVIIVDLFG